MKNFFLVQYWFIKNFLVAIVNKFWSKTIPADELLDVVVISTGGTASSSIMRYLKLFKKINDENNKDGYKHLAKFPFLENSNTKIIYIYGEYEKVYNSYLILYTTNKSWKKQLKTKKEAEGRAAAVAADDCFAK